MLCTAQGGMVVVIGGECGLSFVSATGLRAVGKVFVQRVARQGCAVCLLLPGTRRIRGATDVVLLAVQSPSVSNGCDCL